jgi:hypothetical protein
MCSNPSKVSYGVELTHSQLVSGTVASGATDAFSRRPLSRAYRLSIGPISRAAQGRIDAFVKPAAIARYLRNADSMAGRFFAWLHAGYRFAASPLFTIVRTGPDLFKICPNAGFVHSREPERTLSNRREVY